MQMQRGIDFDLIVVFLVSWCKHLDFKFRSYVHGADGVVQVTFQMFGSGA